MTTDKVSKKYRKLLTLESEHQVFRMIETLDEKTSKEILQKLIVAKMRNGFSWHRESLLENNKTNCLVAEGVV